MDNQIEKNIKSLFESWSGEKIVSISAMPSSGSNRQYHRITGDKKKAIAAYNPDEKENNAFITFSKHFITYKLPVPEIYSENSSEKIYLLEDLGDTTLFSWLSDMRKHNEFSDEILSAYKKVISVIPKFQITAGENLDYRVCYPRSKFDRQSMLWDLSYFKYYFLKLAGLNFDEQKLEDDFQTFTDYLLQADCNYFLYRDFQSRNIMLKDNQPYFIDYQGGRKGALQYDIASLLYDAKADLPQEVREILFNFYLEQIGNYIPVDTTKFTEYYHGYIIIRIMQALGAYGFRGFYEKKEHFLQSIPFALDNLQWLLKNYEIPVNIPTLLNILQKLPASENLRKLGKKELGFKVTINSFAYKYGIPQDLHGNGGGFVFDCRSLHNPGKYEEYKTLSGNDREVIDFLSKEPEIYEFINHGFGLVDKSIETYIRRKFSHILVNFGCTGGQHRSVFCANLLAEHLKKKFDIEVELHHREIEKLNSGL